MQRRQRRLYFLLPFRWMKNDHSRFIRLVMRDITVSFHSFLWKNPFCRLSASLSLNTVMPILAICVWLMDCFLLRSISLSFSVLEKTIKISFHYIRRDGNAKSLHIFRSFTLCSYVLLDRFRDFAWKQVDYDRKTENFLS